jgi:hypothetical protein
VIRLLFGSLLLVAFAMPARAQREDAETFFETKIRPVLADRCFKCHGGKKVSNGLRVDSRQALLQGGDSGPALVPGDTAKSLLIRALRHADETLKMPPDRKLPDPVIADFVSWVERGAAWPTAASSAFQSQQHWAFAPVGRVVPPTEASGAAANPIDRFILGKLHEHGLRPVPPADRRTLLRRVYFDLLGLPPSPEEMADFLADPAPDAWEKVVERLLASPHYGERWGRHWMDVARYADTAGDNADYPVPEARLYRDYIIDAFNADMPYDQFVREQLAGDLLARTGPRERYAAQVIATGFLALSRRYATAPYELWPLTLEDAIDTTGRAFLGLTLRCARCHDHKFDPVTKEDYYALYGIFASTQFPWAGGEELASMKRPREHFQPVLPPDEAAPRQEAHREKRNALQDEINCLEAERADLESARQQGNSPKLDPQLRENKTRLDQLRGDLVNLDKSSLPGDLPGAYAVQDGKAEDAYVQNRGDLGQRGPTVKRGVPKFLGHAISIPTGESGRLQLARWLTRPDHPLTARVMVNRIWQHHFGKGLVTTPSNFGLRGEPPTHPDLLDWLAGRFAVSGWSVKAMHRLILSSRTYQLSSDPDPANAALDPGNRWYWRFDRRRLDAESIRDAMLAVSGNLDRRRPGTHPFPPMEKWTWTQHAPFKDIYPSQHRSVYLMTQRFQRHPYLALFDGPDTNTTTDQRTTSTVPQQALFLWNNPWVKEQAEGLARRLIAATGDGQRRVELAHAWAWQRPAGDVEAARALLYIEEYGRELSVLHAPPDRNAQEAWTSYARILLAANEFVYID